MTSFPSNSREPRKDGEPPLEQKPVVKIVEGRVRLQKKSISVRTRDIFLGGRIRDSFSYVVREVLIPAARDMAFDSLTQGAEHTIYGQAVGHIRRNVNRSGAFGGSGGPVNYNRMSSPAARREEPRERDVSPRGRATHDFNEVIMASRVEADDILNELQDIINEYRMVSVKTLYELLGLEFHHTDVRYGWTNLTDAGVRRIRNGEYILVLPKTEVL